MDEIHKHDVGTILRLTITDDGVAVDVSGSATKQIELRKPSGAVLLKTAAFTNAGVDGKIQYTTIAGDLNEVGDWQMQAKVTFASSSWKSSIATFTVHDNVQ